MRKNTLFNRVNKKDNGMLKFLFLKALIDTNVNTMRNKPLLIGIGLVGMLSGAGWVLTSVQQEPVYQPRMLAAADGEGYDAGGAINKFMQVHANQVSGVIDHADVIQARNQTDAMWKTAKTATLGLEWEFAGPDNIGGRTRAILIHKTNPAIVLAAGVSGGLWRSTNGASSWQAVNDTMANLAVVSLAQATNGDIYAGTGEGMYYGLFGTGAGGYLGGGMWKSTDDGATFQRLASTIPNIPNSGAADWAAVGKIECSVSDPNRVYAATNKGLRRSDDGGQTWTDPINAVGNTVTTDMTIATDGSIWAKVGNRIYYSANGDDGTFNEITTTTVTPGQIVRNTSRMRIAVSPQDPDYVYVVSITAGGALDKVYRSTDRGASWSTIANYGSTSSFNPMNNQGDYDLLLGVDPQDKDHIFMGGVQLWDWTLNGGWNMIHSSFDSPTNPFYVHVDQHEIEFHPNAAGVLYVGNDGGIFRSSNNGYTWAPVQANYGTIQFYALGVNVMGELIGGTQDNGTIYVGEKVDGNTSLNGIRTESILFGPAGAQSLRDGDGGYAAISGLNNDVGFKEMQYGVVGRTENGGQSFESFYDFDRMDPGNIAGTGGFADFVAPFRFWETTNDPFSTDSVKFKADPAFVSLGFGEPGTTQYSGVLPKPQESAIFETNTFVVRLGSQTVVSDAGGNLSGDGTGTFDPSTGAFNVTFNTSFALEVYATCEVHYNAGDTVVVQSAINNLPVVHGLTGALASGDSVMIQDTYQAAFFMGLTSRSGGEGGIWMTRRALDFTQDPPEWFQIAWLGTGETPTSMEISADGNTLWVGTGNGKVFRITNLSMARDKITAEVDSTSSVVVTTLAANHAGRTVTGIGLDRNNPDHVMYTLGNYGNTTYLYRSVNATATTPSFLPKTGNLPAMPLYDVLINQFDPNQVIVGTERGIFTTDNVSAASPVWTPEFGGMPRVPVLMLEQVYDNRSSDSLITNYNGIIYAATHGRGFWKSGTLAQANPIGVIENPVAAAEKESLRIFPNPAVNSTSVALNLTGRSNVAIRVRDLNGKLVKQLDMKRVDPSVTEVKLDVSNLSSGTYIVTTMAGNKVISGKLVVQH